MANIKDTITFRIVLNKLHEKNKSRIQPIGRMIEFEEGKPTFVASNITGSQNLKKGEPVFIISELGFMDEGEYTMTGSIKRTPNNVWYFTPENVKVFFSIFNREFKQVR